MSPHVYLNTFDGIEHDKAKLPVEHVRVPDALKRCPLPEDIRFSLLVDMPVSAEAVVPHILEMPNKIVSIRDHPTLFHEKVRLLLTPSDFPAINRYLESYNAKTF